MFELFYDHLHSEPFQCLIRILAAENTVQKDFKVTLSEHRPDFAMVSFFYHHLVVLDEIRFQ